MFSKKDDAKTFVEFDDVDGEESQINSVAEPQGSNAAKKGLLMIFLLFMILLFAFMGYRALLKSKKTEAVQQATEVADTKVTVPNFQLPVEAPAPPDAMASEPMPVPLATTQPMTSDGTPEITPHQRRLQSSLMIGANSSTGGGETAANTTAAPPPPADSSGASPLAGMLQSVTTANSSADILRNRNLLLAKGTFIRCNMSTRMETQVAGMATCVIPRDIYSDNGTVLLLERGSTVEGEYQQTASQGQSRIFVLWTRIRTPKGVAINLNSPAADPLGGSGVGGYVDNHWWARFGNALLFSLIQDGVATGFNSINNNKSGWGSSENTIVYDNSQSATDEIIKEILKTTANIPPTVYKNQGDSVGIFVARDLDFSNVYQLRDLTSPVFY